MSWIAWWALIIVTSGGGITTVPFRDKSMCEVARKAVIAEAPTSVVGTVCVATTTISGNFQ